jgi:hypothetical protein
MGCQSNQDAWEEAARSNPDVRKALELLIPVVIANHREKLRKQAEEASTDGDR